MPEFDIAFLKPSHFLPFLHIVGVIVFVGFQAHFWLMAKFSMEHLHENEKQDYETIIAMAKRLGYAVYISFFVVAITGAMLKGRFESECLDPMMATIITTKWILMGFLMLNIIYTTYRFNKARKSFENGEYIELHENLIVIIYYFIPLNIAFSFLAVYLGVAYGDL